MKTYENAALELQTFAAYPLRGFFNDRGQESGKVGIWFTQVHTSGSVLACGRLSAGFA